MRIVFILRGFGLLLCSLLALAPVAPVAGAPPSPSRAPSPGAKKGVIGIFDPDYHNGTMPAKGRADKHDRLPTLPAGRTVNRTFVVHNDSTAGQQLTVRIEPVLRTGVRTSRKLTPIVRPVTVPKGGKISLSLPLRVPAVKENSGLELALILQKQNRERFRDSIIFVAVPAGKGGTTVTYQGRDDKTQGDWYGVYGKEAFLVPIKLGRSAYQIPGVNVIRGSGMERKKVDNPFDDEYTIQQQMLNLENTETTEDKRIAQSGPGLKERSPAAFLTSGIPLLIRADTSDGLPHRLSLYLLDYKREKLTAEIAVYDLQGHRLDTQRVTNYGEGVYLRYQFTGAVVVRIAVVGRDTHTLSGVFVDPASAR